MSYHGHNPDHKQDTNVYCTVIQFRGYSVAKKKKTIVLMSLISKYLYVRWEHAQWKCLSGRYTSPRFSSQHLKTQKARNNFEVHALTWQKHTFPAGVPHYPGIHPPRPRWLTFWNSFRNRGAFGLLRSGFLTSWSLVLFPLAEFYRWPLRHLRHYCNVCINLWYLECIKSAMW